MKTRRILTGLAVAFLMLGTPAAASNDFCYLRCQYKCYAVYPGGGDAWRSCYVACAANECSI